MVDGIGKRGIKNEVLGLGERKWEWWQNGKYGRVADDDDIRVVVLFRDGLITPASVEGVESEKPFSGYLDWLGGLGHC